MISTEFAWAIMAGVNFKNSARSILLTLGLAEIDLACTLLAETSLRLI